jgi:hypothetical protein
VARGGQTTPGRIRLRCRAHNQYAAECVYGSAFMRGKRERARERAAHARGGAAAHETARAQAAAAAAHACAEVIPWLRALGFRADEARAAAARCEAIPDAPLEERVRLALSSLAPNRVRRAAPAERSSG